MTDTVLSVVSKVAGYLVAPVGRQCGYVIFSDSYIGQLKEELDKLENARQRVQHSVDVANNNMKLIEPDVEKWVKEAETVANKALGILDYDRRAKKTCFCGWLPNPKERYCLGRGARKTVQAIQALWQGKFERVYYESAPPGQVASSSDVNSSAGDGGDTITDSRATIFRGIMKALDDEKLKVIGVYGHGGVGKTTLLEEVEKKLRKEKRPFRMIVKSKVSQNPDLKKIQDDIAYAFGLKLKDEPSEVGRRDLLCQRLQKDPDEKVLIILDDLWGELDLKAVGIPSGGESRKWKLLLSSRYKDVLEKMLVGRIFHLEGLSDDEAFRLFEKTVGDRLMDKELKTIAAKVVKKLAGLPLLITSVASTLKNKEAPAWRTALIKIGESNIETIVKLSYDHLKSEDEKSLFLLCGLIGGTIQVKTLLVLGMGLDLFEGFDKTIQDARDRLNTMLDSLRSICLLQDDDNDKKNVTIHDLYSEVVVSTPFRGQNFLMINTNYGWWSKEKLERYWAIHLVNVGSDKLAELRRCQFPNLKILMLSQPKESLESRAHRQDERDRSILDLTCTKELRVLYLQYMGIATLPSSMEILRNLRSLCLYRCRNLRYLFLNCTTTALEKLVMLHISKCEEMEEVVSKEDGSQSRAEVMSFPCLRSLTLDRLTNLICFSSGSCSCDFATLEELSIMWCDKFEAFIWSPTSVKMPLDQIDEEDHGSDDGSDEEDHGSPQPLFNEMVAFPNIRILRISGSICKEIWNNQTPDHSFCNLETLELIVCPFLEHIAPSSMWKKLQHSLDTLTVINCKPIKIIYESDEIVTEGGKLRSLYLGSLENLRHIWQFHDLPNVPFPNLRSVRVLECPHLETLFPTFTAEFLGQIETLVVKDCENMKLIAGQGECEEAIDTTITFSNLTKLCLEDLPNLRTISPEKRSQVFPLITKPEQLSDSTWSTDGIDDLKEELDSLCSVM